ncbi:MAG: MAE_28990/MAE_18760 family HEPN-like nuclease [Aurantimonas endophytica]|uniref:MAE_28990/MAE_18760 family HEPN-like nuclease n=1 Tax=Aurantimonas endophytica TaxID=1522175 RepID=UPI003001217E
MAKIKTLSAFQDAIDADFAWRIKEISNLKTEVSGSSSIAKTTLIRAGIALLYAHWEGFIKASSSHYLSYITGQSLTYSELKSCFVFLGLRAHLNRLSEAGGSRGGAEALDFIRSQMNERARVSHPKSINTQSNLSSKVFDNIASSIGIRVDYYEARFNLIDESLLARRNKIAHGEFLDISADEWRALADEVLVMLRTFKTDLENAAALDDFRAPAPAIPAAG